ncbi:hypothetical protein [Empedobacter sp. UBA7248]|uniref:hypothetical protein n=1 Tax=Empedobacter sp. UBA7248 TaxID=1946448 RepID=UPI0025B8C630|nr:hypothetical protein [Empedobacter sp. UBA7248]
MIEVKSKYYLNRDVKPINNKFYKVYFRFNLNGVNHRVKSQMINYLEKTEDLENLENLIVLETKYVNTLLNEYGENYKFKNFENDVYNLNTNLFDYYISEDELFLKNSIIKYKKPINIYGDLYINNLVSYLIKTSNLNKKFLFYSINSFGTIINLYKNEIPVEFIEDKNIKDFVNSCNNILEFSSKNKTNVYKWFFEFQRLDYQKKYSKSSFNLLDTFCKIIYKDIFDKDYEC